MSDRITIRGNVGNDPQHQVLANGVSITRFSVATTHRGKNRSTGEWEDKSTNWYNVSAFRHLADNTFASLKRGDPVIVRGRVEQRSWEAGGRNGTSSDIEADTVGLDLFWGTGSIQRRTRADAAGLSADEGDAFGEDAAGSELAEGEAAGGLALSVEGLEGAPRDPREDAPVPF